MTSLLALHGFTGSPDSWAFLGERVSAPPLLGHVGAPDTDQITSFEGEVDRLAQLARGSERLHVVGYSLGARLALGMAVRHPARITRLTLISGHPGLASEEERRARLGADSVWIDVLLDHGLLAFVDAWEKQPLWATQAGVSAAALERRRAIRLSHDPRGLARSLRITGLGQMPSYWERLARLEMPVTILAGELDLKFSSLARAVCELTPHSTLEIMPGAGHDLLLERPERVAHVIQRGTPG